jgi:hypothetical protein
MAAVAREIQEPAVLRQWQRRFMLHHTSRSQVIRPVPGDASVRVFEMLSEVISLERLLGPVTFSELMDILEMAHMLLSVLPGNQTW